MKQFAKKSIAIILVACLFLAACGANSDEGESMGYGLTASLSSSGGLEKESSNAARWQAEHTVLGKRYEAVAVTDSMIYGCYRQGGSVVLVYITKSTGEIVKEIAIAEVAVPWSVTADSQGNVYVIGSYDSYHSCLWKVDGAGNVSEISEMVLEDTEGALQIILKGMYVSDGDVFYLWYEMALPHGEAGDNSYYRAYHIYVKDADFATIHYERIVDSSDFGYLHDFTDSNTGEALLLIRDMRVTDERRFYVRELSAEEKNGVYLETNMGDDESVPQVFATENGFLYLDGSDLCRYDAEKERHETLFNLIAFGIMPDSIQYLGLKDGAIEVVANPEGGAASEYIVLTYGESTKQILTLGLLQASPEVLKAVAGFNRRSADTLVEIYNYYNAREGYDKAFEKLKLDIVRGTAPDIVMVSGVDKAVFTEKGVFANLYGFMENDSELNKDMLLPTVLWAYEIDGHLYSVAPAFQLYSMWGKASLVNGRSGVTLAELQALLAEHGQTISAIWGFSADEPPLTTLCTFGMDEFIDWNSGTCDFAGEYFQSILRFAKEYDDSQVGGGLAQGIRAGRILLSVGVISSVAHYQLQAQIYGGDLAFIGYPSARSSGTAVSFRSGELAINAHSQNQATAWEFVKYYLLNGYDGGGFPLVKAQFDEAMAAAQGPNMVVNENGETEELPWLGYWDGEGNVFVYEATQADVDAVRQLIASAENSYIYNIDILNIINEEAGAYLSGQKEAQAVAGIIQNRVQLYLRERGE